MRKETTGVLTMGTIWNVMLSVVVSAYVSTSPPRGLHLPFEVYYACETEEEVETALAKDRELLKEHWREFEDDTVVYNTEGELEYFDLPPIPPVKGCGLRSMDGFVMRLIDNTEVEMHSGIIYRIVAIDMATVARPGLYVHKKILLRQRVYARNS